VHLRYFLHLSFKCQQREDLQLVLFTGLILFLMIGGSVWILGDLYNRM
jgi:cytochrome o ubiquinol oxidase operon protein cyoD